MSMWSCPKCWDTPCQCGWEYKDMPAKERAKLAATILGVHWADVWRLTIPEDHPLKESVKKKDNE